MAIPTFVNVGQGQTASSVASISTGSVALTAGNLIVVTVRGANQTGVTDSLGNTYTFQVLATGSNLRIYSCANCLGGSSVITAGFSPNSTNVAINAFQFSGAATSSELINTFTTAAVTAGTTIDLTYDTGGFYDSIIVGAADTSVGTFNFTAITTAEQRTSYIESADHTASSYFYRLPVGPLTSEVVRATSTVSGNLKRFAIATFKPAITAVQEARVTQFGAEILSQPTPTARITQFGVEILSANVAPVVSAEKSYAYIDGIFGLG